RSLSWISDSWPATLPPFTDWITGSTPSGWQEDLDFMEYSAHGYVTQLKRGDRHVVDVTWGFDGSRVTQLLYRRTPGSVFNNLSISYTWNSLGQLSTVNDQASLNTWYGYDAFQRLNRVRIGVD